MTSQKDGREYDFRGGRGMLCGDVLSSVGNHIETIVSMRTLEKNTNRQYVDWLIAQTTYKIASYMSYSKYTNVFKKRAQLSYSWL